MWAKVAMRFKKPPLKLEISTKLEIQTLTGEEIKRWKKSP
jgi:hypothetical protein